MFKFKKLTDITRVPSAQSLAQRELEDAQRALLEARSAVEYSTAMADYHAKRVDRLTEYVGSAA